MDLLSLNHNEVDMSSLNYKEIGQKKEVYTSSLNHKAVDILSLNYQDFVSLNHVVFELQRGGHDVL